MGAEEISRFWESTRAALAEVEMDARVEPVERSDVFTSEGAIKTRAIHRVVMSSLGGTRIRAWYIVPTGVPPKRGWPGIMVVPGYGGTMPLPLHLVQYGYATLSRYPRGQGESLNEWEIEYGTRLVYNVTDKERYYYRGGYMDCVRGLDFLDSRPEIDASRIGVWGFSQGGGLTLATAALDRRVAAAVAGVPWLCNFPVAAGITTSPYGELHAYLAEHPQERDKALDTLSYFDQVNLAGAIACPTLMCSAIVDEVHPLRTVLPAFEQIPSMKSIIVYPDLDHDYRADFSHHGKAWMDRYLR